MCHLNCVHFCSTFEYAALKSLFSLHTNAAHRHPYLETLGYLYMMQLRYGNEGFSRRACSAWRLVFVLALMPWMQKYRDQSNLDSSGEENPVFYSTRINKSMVSTRFLPINKNFTESNDGKEDDRISEIEKGTCRR